MSISLLERNIGKLLEKAATRYKDRTVLIVEHEDVSITFRELDEKVNQYANALRQEGVEQGEHVGVMLPNCLEFPITWLALARLGAVMVPINIRLNVMDLAYILEDSDVTVLVIDTDYIPIFRKIDSKIHRIDTVFQVGEAEENVGISLVEVARDMSCEIAPAHPRLDDLMNIQYTSGTTGLPKGALTTHEYWLILGTYCAQIMSITPEDIFLEMSPFYYMDPQYQLLMSLSTGSTMVLAEKISSENFARCVKKYPVTCCWGRAEYLYLREFEKDKNHHLRYMSLMAFPPELHAELEERFHVVARELYGMTEIGHGTNVAIEDTHMVGSGSVGKPPWFRDLKIADENGNEMPQGESGELLVKGTGIMKGYYKKPDVNVKSYFGEYFRTGDLFRQDEDGYYYFIGRIKDIIRRMGDNISAAEVENVLISNPKILEAAVVPVPDPIRDEEVKAYISLTSGETPETITPEKIIEYCLERIAKFKVPRYIEYVKEFPKTASGKIQKNILIAQKNDLTEGCYDRFGNKLT
jgi:acyl-coenzyme A synthetase/AMP-(fatty) acid ligase